VLALVIVGSGLLSSLAIALSAWPLYNAYIGIRDLFGSEKIKNQNKDYDNLQENLHELKELFFEKRSLSEKQAKLVKQIESKLHESGANKFVSAKDTHEENKNCEKQDLKNLAVNDSHSSYGPLFKIPVAADSKEAGLLS
jgi:hypothetical protein